jgi:hypothetical protein
LALGNGRHLFALRAGGCCAHDERATLMYLRQMPANAVNRRGRGRPALDPEGVHCTDAPLGAGGALVMIKETIIEPVVGHR